MLNEHEVAQSEGIPTKVTNYRRWSTEEKLKILIEMEAPGVSHAYVARKYGITKSHQRAAPKSAKVKLV